MQKSANSLIVGVRHLINSCKWHHAQGSKRMTAINLITQMFPKRSWVHFPPDNSKCYAVANLDTRHENGRIAGYMWGSLIVSRRKICAIGKRFQANLRESFWPVFFHLRVAPQLALRAQEHARIRDSRLRSPRFTYQLGFCRGGSGKKLRQVRNTLFEFTIGFGES